MRVYALKHPKLPTTNLAEMENTNFNLFFSLVSMNGLEITGMQKFNI